jgi:hypothetical protein
LGIFGAAGSAIVTGFIVEKAQNMSKYTRLDAYHFIFMGYSAIDIVKLLACLCLSSKVEDANYPTHVEKYRKGTKGCLGEQSPLMADESLDQYQTFRALAPVDRAAEIARPRFVGQTSVFIWRFSLVIALDNLANGLAQMP